MAKFSGLDELGINPIEWKHIGAWICDRGLEDTGKYISWDKKYDYLILGGSFSIEEIIELAEYLKLQMQK